MPEHPPVSACEACDPPGDREEKRSPSGHRGKASGKQRSTLHTLRWHAGTAAQTNTLTGSMTVTVIRVYPNGNLEIKGQKKLILNDGSEYLRLSGIIRPEDISASNTISSSNIADAKITYTNAGVYATSTKPGWLSKIFREITPF